jgi:type IV pilus assembly protein PilQ
MMRGVSLPNRSNPASQRNDWNNNYNNTTNTDTNRNSRQRLNTQNSQNFNNYNNAAEALVNMLPKDIIEALEIKSDVELNSFVVSGPAQNIQRFQEFISAIDKQIPVILIEVMFIEHAKNASIETGLEMGIGTEPTTTEGKIFPSSNLNLGAQTINKIIGGFNGFGSSNLGRVAPNFYASIKALENSGTIHVKSTPKLSTLNGHKASLAIGETTYFVITNRDFIGSQIPQTSTITNYQAIDAELALDIMPLVSGDGNITMSIQVIQSSFNGTRIAPDAPPDMNSRSFSSTIRVKDQDVIILGGLEENTSNDIGSGVPLLARIPVIKWFFSSRKKENSAKKLSILIKPTVIQ